MVTTESILQHSLLPGIVIHNSGFNVNRNIYTFLKNQKNLTEHPAAHVPAHSKA